MEAQLTDAEKPEKNKEYWRALQSCVCSVCLDRRDDGGCALPGGRVCGLNRHLPLLIDVVHSVDSMRMDDYLGAVERGICTRCPEQDAAGRCDYRDKALCALYTYLPLVLDAVDMVDEDRRRREKA